MRCYINYQTSANALARKGGPCSSGDQTELVAFREADDLLKVSFVFWEHDTSRHLLILGCVCGIKSTQRGASVQLATDARGQLAERDCAHVVNQWIVFDTRNRNLIILAGGRFFISRGGRSFCRLAIGW